MTLPVVPAGLLVRLCRLLVPPALSDLMISRLARSSVSVAETGLPTVGVTVAVFDNVPVAVELTVPLTVYVIELPAGSTTAGVVDIARAAFWKAAARRVPWRSTCRRSSWR